MTQLWWFFVDDVMFLVLVDVVCFAANCKSSGTFYDILDSRLV